MRQHHLRVAELGAQTLPPGREQGEQALVGQALAGDGLDADVVGARVPVLLDTLADGALIAPGDHRVHQPVGAAPRQIGLAEAEPQQVVAVVGHLEIPAEPPAAGGPRPPRILPP